MRDGDSAGDAPSPGPSTPGPSGDVAKRGSITGCFVKISKEEFLQANRSAGENGSSSSSSPSCRPRPDYKSMDVAADVDDHEEDPDFDKDGDDGGARKRRTRSAQPAPKRQKAERKKVDKCHHCRQPIDDPDKLTFYEGHPEGAKMEVEALFDDTLTVEYIEGEALDERNDYRLTGFTFYDREGHVVPFGSGLVERNAELLFSGYVKPVYDDNPSLDGGVAVFDGGPINEWWTTGFDGGERHLIGVSTELAHYYLTAPSDAYAPFMEDVDRKVFVAKLVVERLLEARETMENVEHEDLLHMLEGRAPPGSDKKFTNDDLVKYSEFIVDQVYNFEEAGDDDEDAWMMESPCIKEIITISGIKRNRSRGGSGGGRIRSGGALSAQQKMKKAVFTKATTTPLVRFVFESFFKDQIAEDGKKIQGPRKRRCGKCDGCLAPNCKVCSHCLDMKQYGGKGTGKQACIKRKCEAPIEALDKIEAEDEEDYYYVDEEDLKSKSILAAKKEEELEEEDEEKENKDKKSRRSANSNEFKNEKQRSAVDFFKPKKTTVVEGSKSSKCKWFEKEEKQKIDGKTYYKSAEVGEEVYNRGDFAMVSYEVESGRESFLRRVASFYEDEVGQKFAHVQWYDRGKDTLLNDAADPREIFQVLYCDNTSLSNLKAKVTTVFWPTPSFKEWAKEGGTESAALAEPPFPGDGDQEKDNCFFYRMRYDEDASRFEQALDFTAEEAKNAKELDFCAMCESEPVQIRRAGKVVRGLEPIGETDETKGAYLFRALRTKNETFCLNDAVFFAVPGGANTKSSSGKSRQDEDNTLEKRKREVDEEKYPEFFRKTERVKGSNEALSKPFGIGIVVQIMSQGREGRKNLKLRVRKMYRPENTCLTQEEAFAKDLNLVFWSDDVISIDWTQLRGRCYIKNENFFDNGVERWTKGGEYRFYYNMAYDRHKRSFEELPVEAERYGRQTKGGGKGKKSSVKTDAAAASSTSAFSASSAKDEGAHPTIKRPLNCLDVFAGCGGLSLGLHQAGVADSKWAIEVFEPAANAYKLNNPKCEVFTDDCNLLLKLAIDREEFNSKKQRLPEKGQVELLVGGPPCQGFSGMNRFNYREYSSFKNSLIASYLSFCEFYRPKYFILENVRNFATFKKSAVLRLCIRALLKMGYSCSFAILQAGHYGVSQTRRRAILMAAAPGEILPLFPEPQHVFVTTPLSAQVGDKVCVSNCKWVDSAPYRTITVRDCMSDLPEILQGGLKSGSGRAIAFHGDECTSYNSEPRTHFQRLMRYEVLSNGLRDHITKVMSPLVEARMSLIPTTSGSDWRDLPNVVMKLSDGTYTDKLVYNYHDYVRGKSKSGAFRGVCNCMAGKHKTCNPDDKQTNTIIPWCLPHTSARHNQWAGLYGRLEYDGFFSTTVTNPEPMGKQGRVLHPDQDRLVSVRECARSQGFPDSYRFYGNVLDKHRQVGNAVAPPMGYYIGLEVRKAMAKARKESPELDENEIKREVEEVKKEEEENNVDEDAVETEEKELIKQLMEEDAERDGDCGAGGSGNGGKLLPFIDDDSD